MSTPSVNVALEIFPTDIAVELKVYAEKDSLHSAKIRRGRRKAANADKSEAETHFAAFKDKCQGLLSDISCEEIRLMIGYAGWYAANTRKSEQCWRRRSRNGYKCDANNDKREVEEHYQNIVKEGEISVTLARNIREMSWGAAWLAANTLFGHQEDEGSQKATLDSFFDKIHGEVNLAELLSQRPRVVTPSAEVSLEIFPPDVADELKGYAEKIGWHCAKLRLGNRGEADADKIEAKTHYDSFKEKCKGLLSGKSCQDIRSMIYNTAWYAANTTRSKRCWWYPKRNQYNNDAASDKSGIEAKYQDVVNEGEISETLAKNVREMSWYAAWFAVHTIIGRHDDALRDKAFLDSFFDKIHGDVSLVAMNFIMDEAKILSQKPKLVSEKNLVNRGDVEQTMKFAFSMTEGRTHSTSHTIGFSYGINTSFSAGFAAFGEFNLQLSLSFSHSQTFNESTSTGTNTSFEFPLLVPAHSSYVAKGIVYEAQMDVPYELVFDFGGAHRSVRGRWKGVACSKATYEVDKKEDLLPCNHCNIL